MINKLFIFRFIKSENLSNISEAGHEFVARNSIDCNY